MYKTDFNVISFILNIRFKKKGFYDLVEINNYNTYKLEMRKSLTDKVYFTDKIKDIKTIVDFGCADGTLINYLNEKHQDVKYVGYDIDTRMLSSISTEKDNVTFTNNLSVVNLCASPKDSLLNLSSVVHEVYSYEDEKGIEEFWKYVFNSGYKYITIRDMAVNGFVPDDILEWDKVEKGMREKGQKAIRRLMEFRNVWGDSPKQFIHFLLKYRYEINWEREVCENYIPLEVEQLFKLIPDGYRVLSFVHYTLPFLKDSVKRDFKIDLSIPTHYKLVLEKIK